MVVGSRDSESGSRRAGGGGACASVWDDGIVDGDVLLLLCAAPLDGHHDDDDDDDDVLRLVSAFGSAAVVGFAGFVAPLLPNSACICAMNLAISGSLYVGSVDGAGCVSVPLLVTAVTVAGALAFGEAPDDHSQPIFLFFARWLSRCDFGFAASLVGGVSDFCVYF